MDEERDGGLGRTRLEIRLEKSYAENHGGYRGAGYWRSGYLPPYYGVHNRP